MSNKTPYNTNNNIAYDCKFHVVWTPKYRRKVLTGKVSSRLAEIIEQVCNERDAELIEYEVMTDYVHVLVGIDPQYGIHRLVKQIKGRSSRLLRNEFPKLKSQLPTLWTNSYFVATVGGAPVEVVKQYIENQKGV